MLSFEIQVNWVVIMLYIILFKVATAVNGATENSLVIVDEFGKGTATVLSNGVISSLSPLIYMYSVPYVASHNLCFSWIDRWSVLVDCHTPPLAQTRNQLSENSCLNALS